MTQRPHSIYHAEFSPANLPTKKNAWNASRPVKKSIAINAAITGGLSMIKKHRWANRAAFFFSFSRMETRVRVKKKLFHKSIGFCREWVFIFIFFLTRAQAADTRTGHLFPLKLRLWKNIGSCGGMCVCIYIYTHAQCTRQVSKYIRACLPSIGVRLPMAQFNIQ